MRKKSVYKEIKLPNGGIIWYAKNNITQATYMDLVFPCGSYVEKIPGLAHVVEHMTFKGTDKHTKQELNDEFSKFGSENAFTGWGAISFQIDVLPKDITKALDFWEEILNHSLYTEEQLEEEKEVILQEIKMYADKYNQNNEYVNCYSLYKDEFLKGKILGDEKSLKRIKAQDVKDYANKYFVANNMEFTIITPLSLKKVKKMIVERLYSKLKVVEDFEKLPVYFMNIKDCNFYVIEKENIKKTYLNINFKINHGKQLEDKEWLMKFAVIKDYLRDFSRGVTKLLRNEKHLIYACYISHYIDEKDSFLCFQTECDKKNINDIIINLKNYLQGIIDNGLDEETVKKLKAKYKYAIAASAPKVSTYSTILTDFKYYGKIQNRKKNREIYFNANIEKLNEIFKEVFANPIVSASIYGDVDETEVMTKAEFKKVFKNNKKQTKIKIDKAANK